MNASPAAPKPNALDEDWYEDWSQPDLDALELIADRVAYATRHLVHESTARWLAEETLEQIRRLVIAERQVHLPRIGTLARWGRFTPVADLPRPGTRTGGAK